MRPAALCLDATHGTIIGGYCPLSLSPRYPHARQGACARQPEVPDSVSDPRRARAARPKRVSLARPLARSHPSVT